MNYDLAMMALEGLARAPMTVTVDKSGVIIEGEASSFKELARLCLLLGGAQESDDAFDLQPGVHVAKTSQRLQLKLA